MLVQQELFGAGKAVTSGRIQRVAYEYWPFHLPKFRISSETRDTEMRSARWRNRAFSCNKRVIKLHWNYIVRYTRQQFGFLTPVDRTGFPVDVSVNFDYLRMENLHPRRIAALQFDFFSPGVRTKFTNPNSHPPQHVNSLFQLLVMSRGKAGLNYESQFGA